MMNMVVVLSTLLVIRRPLPGTHVNQIEDEWPRVKKENEFELLLNLILERRGHDSSPCLTLPEPGCTGSASNDFFNYHS